MLCEISQYFGPSLISIWIAANVSMFPILMLTSGPVFYLYYWPSNVTYEKWKYKVSNSYQKQICQSLILFKMSINLSIICFLEIFFNLLRKSIFLSAFAMNLLSNSYIYRSIFPSSACFQQRKLHLWLSEHWRFQRRKYL